VKNGRPTGFDVVNTAGQSQHSELVLKVPSLREQGRDRFVLDRSYNDLSST